MFLNIHMFVKYWLTFVSKFEYRNLFGEYFTDNKISYILYTVYIQGVHFN